METWDSTDLNVDGLGARRHESCSEAKIRLPQQTDLPASKPHADTGVYKVNVYPGDSPDVCSPGHSEPDRHSSRLRLIPGPLLPSVSRVSGSRTLRQGVRISRDRDGPPAPPSPPLRVNAGHSAYITPQDPLSSLIQDY